MLGVVVSVAWNQAVGNLWKTDAGYFGIKVDSTYQKHRLLHAPWDFAADTVRTVVNQSLGWFKTLVDVGPSVTHWPWALAVIVAVYAVVSIQRTARARHQPPVASPALIVLVSGRAGGVIAANYIYWTTPGLDEVGGVQPRYLVPLMALVPVAIGAPWGWTRPRVPGSRSPRSSCRYSAGRTSLPRAGTPGVPGVADVQDVLISRWLASAGSQTGA